MSRHFGTDSTEVSGDIGTDVLQILEENTVISKAEVSTREPVHVSSVITSTGSRAGIRHVHGFPCSSQPY